jgi:3-oxoadipate enol-lactonase
MPIAHSNGVDLHYRIDGSGDQAVLLINGVGDDLEGWGYQRDDFAAAGLRVVTFDTRGCGSSGQPPGPYTSAEMARDAKGLADALRLAPFHLVGVSCTARLAAITTPAVVLASQDDIIIKPALSRALFEALPAADWALLPGGHAAFLEDPPAWNRTVINFIAAHR